jgi:hypothetical protein
LIHNVFSFKKKGAFQLPSIGSNPIFFNSVNQKGKSSAPSSIGCGASGVSIASLTHRQDERFVKYLPSHSRHLMLK